MKILLAGAADDQVEFLSATHPAATFLKSDTLEGDGWRGADALIGFTRGAFDKVFTPELLLDCGNIRWVHASGAGIDYYVGPELAATPFVMTNGKVIQGPEVSDHAVALLLALTRRIHLVLRGAQKFDMPRPAELRGKKALVIGFGGIGMSVAERLSAFGMRVSVVTDDLMPLVSFVDKVWLSDQLAEALPDADAVIMAAPLTQRTRKLMNAEMFARMKQGAYYVNVSRGGTTCTQSLLAAVADGRFAGVGIDVTDPEPLPDDHPLHAFPSVLITPHLAGMSDNLRGRNIDLISTNIRRFIAGLPLVNVVDKIRGF